jgi:NADPH:quinone reductase-like Zn-dependent oxidoreductase
MTTPRTMHAVRIRSFGGPDVVEIAEIDVPQPGDNELLLTGVAVGIALASGLPRSRLDA